MERFYAYVYRGKELTLLNSCRMHLHAVHLSADVCVADGHHLTDDAMEVKPDQQRSLPFSWPHTHRPDLQTRSLY